MILTSDVIEALGELEFRSKAVKQVGMEWAEGQAGALARLRERVSDLKDGADHVGRMLDGVMSGEGKPIQSDGDGG